MNESLMITSSHSECIQHCDMKCIEFNIIKTSTIDHENVSENSKSKTDEKQENTSSTALSELTIMCKLAIPVCITSISRVIMGNTDISFLGHLGTKQLAGASVADIASEILTTFVYSPAWSLNALCSQAIGSGNHVMAGYWLQLTIFICTVLTLPVYIGYFFVGDLISLFASDTDVVHYASLFSRFASLFLWTLAMCEIIRIFHESLEIVQPITYISIFAAAINIFFNYFFIYISDLHFIGSPLATAASALLQLVLYYLWCFKIKKYYKIRKTWNKWSIKETIGNWCRMKRFFNIVIPNMISNASENWAYQVICFYAATLKSEEIASLSCMFAVWGILWGFYSGFGTASITRISKKIGAKNIYQAKLVTKLSLFLSVVVCCGISVTVYVLRNEICRLYTNDYKVQKIMSESIPFLCILYVIGGIGWCAMNVLESMSKNKAKGIICVGTAWFGYVPGSLYFGFYDGNKYMKGLSAVSCIFVVGIAVECIRTLFLWIVLATTNWKEAADQAQERNKQYENNKSSDDVTDNHSNLESILLDSDDSSVNKFKAASAV